MSRIQTLPKHAVYEGNLVLVNARHPLHPGYHMSFAPVCGRSDMLLQRSAWVLLNALMDAIDGWGKIFPVSAWRSQQEQEAIWEHSIKDNGLDFTKRYVAQPGCSEHQTGLAIDLGLNSEHIDFIRPDFPDAGICAQFRKNAARYGFIERYPKGKETVTGIAHEPWHFRFVGTPHAQIMTQLELTLEEYIAFLHTYSPSHPYRLVFGTNNLTLFYLPAEEQADTPFPFGSRQCHTVSGDNCGGFIVTQWEISR